MNRKKVIYLLLILQLLLLALFFILISYHHKEPTDTISPVIQLKGEETIIIPMDTFYHDEGCIVIDNQDGDISNKVTITGKVNTHESGEYWIYYQVSDSSGNQASNKRKVMVTEKTNSINPTSTQALNSKRGIPVLMYHFFYDETKGAKGKDNNWISISKFEAQMKYLSDNEFYFPSWTELEDYIDGKIGLPEKSIMITIDDGDESFLKLAIPIIEKYNVKVTSFLITSWNGDWVVPQYRSDKIQFQSHSHDMHKAGKDGKGAFLTLNHDKALEDITTSKHILGNATIFCYPFGHYNDTTKKILKEGGYRLAFTTKHGRVYQKADKLALPRIRISKEDSLSYFKNIVK